MLNIFENRKAVESAFKVDDGIIQGGGRFESSAVFAPYYYERAIDGASDQVVSLGGGGSVDVFEVTDSDRIMFPELAEAEAVALMTDESGAIVCRPITWVEVHGMECAEYADPF